VPQAPALRKRRQHSQQARVSPVGTSQQARVSPVDASQQARALPVEDPPTSTAIPLRPSRGRRTGADVADVTPDSSRRGPYDRGQSGVVLARHVHRQHVQRQVRVADAHGPPTA
jgi:hypothetical protein